MGVATSSSHEISPSKVNTIYYIWIVEFHKVNKQKDVRLERNLAKRKNNRQEVDRLFGNRFWSQSFNTDLPESQQKIDP